jgi:uncharacterized membrane protein (UPF0127 family)
VSRRASGLAAITTAAVLTLGAATAGASAPTRSIGPAIRAASPAQTPFRGLTATTVHVGGRAFRVVIAKTEAQRQRGLRHRRDLGRYDGMLFVFAGTTSVGFTMSTVPVPLDIGFYRSDGHMVDVRRMVPCSGSDASCPVYRARASFRYALETLIGGLAHGRLSG